MMELTINGNVFAFNFGMGFLREINKTVTAPVDGMKNVEQNIGLRYKVLNLLDYDLEALVEVLFAANKGQSPRVTRDAIDNYIDNECEDIDALFAEVLDFLKRANATKKATAAVIEAAEKELKKTK